jgi:hypothetical protein
LGSSSCTTLRFIANLLPELACCLIHIMVVGLSSPASASNYTACIWRNGVDSQIITNALVITTDCKPPSSGTYCLVMAHNFRITQHSITRSK